MKSEKKVMKIAGNIFYIQNEGDIAFLVLFLSHKGFRIDQISYILGISEQKVLEYLNKWYRFK